MGHCYLAWVCNTGTGTASVKQPQSWRAYHHDVGALLPCLLAERSFFDPALRAARRWCPLQSPGLPMPPCFRLHQEQQVPADAGAVDGQGPAMRLLGREGLLVGEEAEAFRFSEPASYHMSALLPDGANALLLVPQGLPLIHLVTCLQPMHLARSKADS